ncbi:MAG: hypothetical protein AAFV31_05460, partial [Pseudomonadota bacterium]
MVEITDRASARAWLEGKPREVQVAFAARAALRALPGIAAAPDATLGGIALPVMRAMLTSSVAAVRSTDDVNSAADSAAARSAASAAAAYSADDSAADSAAARSAASAAAAYSADDSAAARS